MWQALFAGAQMMQGGGAGAGSMPSFANKSGGDFKNGASVNFGGDTIIKGFTGTQILIAGAIVAVVVLKMSKK